MRSARDKYDSMVKLIVPENYFLDYVKLNWAFPLKNVRYGEKEKVQMYARDTYSKLKAMHSQFRENDVELNGVMILIDQHYNVQIDFKGSFFRKTDKCIDDVKEIYKWFLEYNNIVQVNWESAEINQLVRCTVARVDFACQKKSDFTGKFVAIVSKNNTDVVSGYEIPFQGARYFSGITIAPEIGRKTKNIFFRAYDKRFAKNTQACLDRFGSIRFVRKEWAVKGAFLRNVGIATPEDLVRSCTHPKILAQVIKKFRKSKDVILRNDNNLYKSLHDLNARHLYKNGFKNEITLKEFEKIYDAKFHIFLNKEKVKQDNKLMWNPYSQLKGMIKHMENMTHKEFIDFQELMLKKMEANIYENFDWQDLEQVHFDKLCQVIKLLKEIPKQANKASLGYEEEKKAVEKFMNLRRTFVENYDKRVKVPMVTLAKGV